MIQLFLSPKLISIALLSLLLSGAIGSVQEKPQGNDMASLILSLKGKEVYCKNVCNEKDACFGRITEVRADYFVVSAIKEIKNSVAFSAIIRIEVMGGKGGYVIIYLR